MSDQITPPAETEDDKAAKNANNEDINRAAKADRRRREQAEKERDELKAQLEARDKAALTEAERKEKETTARIMAEADAKYAPMLKNERTMRMVERVLHNQNADVESCIVLLALGDIETEEDAKTAVAALLERKPNLVLTPGEPAPHQPGAPRRAVPPKGGPGPEAGMIPAAQIRAWMNNPEEYPKHADEIARAIAENRVTE
jgi:hypothetical protein